MTDIILELTEEQIHKFNRAVWRLRLLQEELGINLWVNDDGDIEICDNDKAKTRLGFIGRGGEGHVYDI